MNVLITLVLATVVAAGPTEDAPGIENGGSIGDANGAENLKHKRPPYFIYQGQGQAQGLNSGYLLNQFSNCRYSRTSHCNGFTILPAGSNVILNPNQVYISGSQASSSGGSQGSSSGGGQGSGSGGSQGSGSGGSQGSGSGGSQGSGSGGSQGSSSGGSQGSGSGSSQGSGSGGSQGSGSGGSQGSSSGGSQGSGSGGSQGSANNQRPNPGNSQVSSTGSNQGPNIYYYISAGGGSRAKNQKIGSSDELTKSQEAIKPYNFNLLNTLRKYK